MLTRIPGISVFGGRIAIVHSVRPQNSDAADKDAVPSPGDSFEPSARAAGGGPAAKPMSTPPSQTLEQPSGKRTIITNIMKGEVVFEGPASGVKSWLMEQVANGKSLRGLDLSGANLRQANLRKANLRKADLGGANLRQANLGEADLGKANLRQANLRKANLRKADLCGANLREANLYGANLNGADLYEANLRKADLCGANLEGAVLDGSTRLP